jgi:arsenate reductase
LLDQHGIDYRYRDYRQEPLDVSELRLLMKRLGVGPKEVLRRRDRAFRELGLTGEEADDTLLGHMSAHPTLLERPIGIAGERAVVGRPPDALLDLAAGR